ncbi:MAG TPA: TetR/AcrR family transcriptional regulator [Balneolaceae bacterium]|nr:TetR/AcrR family transcriptional regulator [Balneolaceae bacterium]
MQGPQKYSETEEQIFRAAIEEFAQNGKRGARMQAIAEHVGCNKALVHYYFRNKERLYEEVFDFLFSRFFITIHHAITDAPTFEETLSRFVDKFTEFLKEFGPYPILMLKEMDMESKKRRFERVKEKIGASPISVFTEKMEQAVERGEIRNLDARQTFMSVMGECIYLFISFPMLSLSNPEAVEHKKEIIEERKRHIIDLIYNGLKTTKD